MDICGDVAPHYHKGGIATRTSDIPAPNLKDGKGGASDLKGGTSIPRSNSKDGSGRPPCTMPPSGEGFLDPDVGVVLCG